MQNNLNDSKWSYTRRFMLKIRKNLFFLNCQSRLYVMTTTKLYEMLYFVVLYWKS